MKATEAKEITEEAVKKYIDEARNEYSEALNKIYNLIRKAASSREKSISVILDSTESKKIISVLRKDGFVVDRKDTEQGDLVSSLMSNLDSMGLLAKGMVPVDIEISW